MISKTLRTCVLSGFIAAFALPAASALAADTARIGVSLYGQDNFAAQGKDGIVAYAKQRNIDVLVNEASYDVTKQADQIMHFISMGVDGILVAPVEFNSLAPQLKRAREAGIKVGLVNAAVKDTSSVDVAVLPDNVAAGRQAAQMVLDHIGAKGNVALLQCKLGASYTIDRTAGMEETIAKNPDVHVVAKDGVTNTSDAANLVSNWLNTHPDLVGVIACGDEIALGAVAAAKQAGKQIAVVGVDGTAQGLDAVKAGQLVGTQMQNGYVELATGLAALNQVVQGKETQKTYTYVMAPVTKETVDKFYPNIVTEKQAFLDHIADLVDANLASGDIANETLK